MAKDKRSRSRKPSGKNQGSGSREVSTDSAERNPSPSPSSAPAQGPSSDQDQDAPQASDAPMLTYDGASESARPVEDLQSPTGTDQSLLDVNDRSPVARRFSPYNNLADELKGADFESSDGDTNSGGEQESATVSESQIDKSSEENSAAQQSATERELDQTRAANTGQQTTQSEETDDTRDIDEVRAARAAEEFEDEVRKRLAAEERVRALEAEALAENQRYESEKEAAEKGFKRAISRLERDREGEKEKYELKYDENDQKIQDFQAQIQKHVDNVQNLTVALEDCQGSLASKVEGNGASTGDNGAEDEQEALRGMLQREFDASTGGPISPREGPRPGSARFLLAEYEYLLNKDSQLYEAVLATANYADGRGASPSNEHKRLYDTFKVIIADMNEFLEKNEDRPVECLVESGRDWTVSVEENGW
ncbi:hypothetical protein Daus18300_003448 [Diaporthe australafricana]|uniref:GRIP domain-containing protein n=1 Tax=Diaporthe australafricana TaxID=127596 RepID=A0ABR3XG47_9PEZI